MSRLAATVLTLCLLAPLAGCSSNTANVSIPPGEQFVLGEYERGKFRVELTNRSDEAVRVEARNEAGEVTQGFGLDARGSATVYVDSGERVILQNASASEVTVRAVLNQEVEGMRYEPVDEAADPA